MRHLNALGFDRAAHRAEDGRPDRIGIPGNQARRQLRRVLGERLVQRGQALGWPTANLRIPPERVTPPDGVYAARASYEGASYDAVAYIGSRPTFGTGERLIEVNLLDHSDNLYGKAMAVEFIERLRGDHTFPSPQELAAQIARDVDRAKASLRRHVAGAQQP